MQVGDPSTFAIECVHEPIPNGNAWVFGRMRIWLCGLQVGDFDEPACMLNVTAGHLQSVLERLSDLEEPAFVRLSDAELFRLLDEALYIDDDRTSDQVVTDAHRYWKFDFLTNGGESFDRSKSFISLCEGSVRILFEEPPRGIVSARVAPSEFAGTVEAFLRWVETEGRKHAG